MRGPSTILTAGAVALASPAMAQQGTGPANLSLAPVLVELPAGTPGATVRLGNVGPRPVPVQLRLFGWSQADGTDETYAAASDVVVTPSILELAPRAVQILRIARTGPPAGSGERAFRLVIDQLPDRSQTDATGANVRLRIVAPVFLDTPAGAAPRLTWTIDRARLTVANAGNRRAQLSTVTIVSADGTRTEIKNAAPAYALAGSRREWALPAGACVPAGGRLVAMVDEIPTDVAVPPTC